VFGLAWVIFGVAGIGVGVMSIVRGPSLAKQMRRAEAQRGAEGYRVNFIAPLRWVLESRLRSFIWGVIEIGVGVGVLLLAFHGYSVAMGS
jgi:hypothetical protein